MSPCVIDLYYCSTNHYDVCLARLSVKDSDSENTKMSIHYELFMWVSFSSFVELSKYQEQ